MKKAKLQTIIRVRAYPILADAAEAAIDYGWYRAHKHTETPDETMLKQCIHDALMSELCEILDFGGDDE